MSTQTPPGDAQQQEGGLLSTVLVGAAILGFAGWFLFGRGDGEVSSKAAESSKRAASSAAAQPGGLGARAADPVRAVDRDGPAGATRALVTPEPEPEPRTPEEKLERAQRDLRRRIDSCASSEAWSDTTGPHARGGERRDPEYTSREWDRKKENMQKNLEREAANRGA